MKCPKCDIDIFCGCASCKPRNKGKFMFVATIDGDHFKCTNCGHTLHGNDWLDVEWDQYQAILAARKAE